MGQKKEWSLQERQYQSCLSVQLFQALFGCLSLPLWCTVPENLLFARLCLNLSSRYFSSANSWEHCVQSEFRLQTSMPVPKPCKWLKTFRVPFSTTSDSIQAVLECFHRLLTNLILSSAPTLPFPSSDPAVLWPFCEKLTRSFYSFGADECERVLFEMYWSEHFASSRGTVTCTLQRAVFSSPAWWLHLTFAMCAGERPACLLYDPCLWRIQW